MKLSELVNEVNNEQELLQLCDKLCEDLLKEHLKQYPTLTEYSFSYETRGRKYIKVIQDSGNQRSVWGFINKKEFKKGSTGITFRSGDTWIFCTSVVNVKSFSVFLYCIKFDIL